MILIGITYKKLIYNVYAYYTINTHYGIIDRM
jgi:hypothetical protein